MSRYLIINLLILAGPLLLSFENQIKFYKNMPRLFFVFLIVGVPFIVWDIIATGRSDWRFADEYVGSAFLFNLPLEEIFFFITVLYAAIFSYEVIRHYIFEKRVKASKYAFYILAVVSAVSGLIMIHVPYTSTVLLIASFALFMSGSCFFELISSAYYWIFMFALTVLFFIFNYILTSLPVVIYNPDAIIGFRILTIPIEDSLYNYALLTLYVGVYDMLGKRKKNSKQKDKLTHNLGGGY